MATITRRIALAGSAAFIALSISGTANAEDLKLTIGYQTVVEPSKVAQADGSTKRPLAQPSTGASSIPAPTSIAAIASGSVDIGYVGSSPLAAAASRELPIETIFVVGLIGESEALVARNGSGVDEGRRPRRQEGRGAVRLDHALQPARGAEA